MCPPGRHFFFICLSCVPVLGWRRKSQQMQTGPWNQWGSCLRGTAEASRSGTLGQSCCSHWEISVGDKTGNRAQWSNWYTTCIQLYLREWISGSTRLQAHTTLGLKGGSTSLFSRASQLMVLKKGCARTSPTTPNLRLGSRSNSWRKITIISYMYMYIGFEGRGSHREIEGEHSRAWGSWHWVACLPKSGARDSEYIAARRPEKKRGELSQGFSQIEGS